MKLPYKLYKPTKVDDDQGGSTPRLGSASILWGIMDFYQATTVLKGIDVNEDVKVKYIITEWESTDQYEVTRIDKVAGAPEKSAILEKLKKPISP